MMNSAKVVETTVITTDNIPSQDWTRLDNGTTLSHEFILLNTANYNI